MNDDTQLNREQLEAATSRSLPAGAPLDSETSALRDGFMALGHAVESTAAAEYDEAALIARVQSACRHEADVELPRRQASRVWPLLLSGALAAAALVAAVRIAVTWPASTDVVVTQPAPAAGDSHVDPLTPADESAVAGSWHDPLDEEIAAAQSSLTRLGASPGGIDDTLSNMNQTLEAMSDELVGESL